MSDYIITVNWTTVCHPCGRRHNDVREVDTRIKYDDPPIPDECKRCGYPLADEPFAWHRTIEIGEVHSL